jgi:hypothetical protein
VLLTWLTPFTWKCAAEILLKQLYDKFVVLQQRSDVVLINDLIASRFLLQGSIF